METLTRSLKLRHVTEVGAMPVVAGYAVRWNEWTEVDSLEGHFLERFSPGAFDQSIREDLARIRVLFQHGRDAVIGQRPLGSIEELRDDGVGLHYEVALLDSPYVTDLVPGIRSGLYGASVSFRVRNEDLNRRPLRSRRNPDGIPERTISAARLYEFSIVTFPQYSGATAGLRGWLPRWYIRTPVARMDYLPVAERSRPGREPWRLPGDKQRPGHEPWRLGPKREPWRL